MVRKVYEGRIGEMRNSWEGEARGMYYRGPKVVYESDCIEEVSGAYIV